MPLEIFEHQDIVKKLIYLQKYTCIVTACPQLSGKAEDLGLNVVLGSVMKGGLRT